MNNRKTMNDIRARRAKRVRARVRGTGAVPRLTVFRSNRYITAQLIDDEKGNTLLAVTPRELKGVKGAKSASAAALGELLAKKAKEAGISRAVFDRGSYAYHGRVKAFAEGARSGGLAI